MVTQAGVRWFNARFPGTCEGCGTRFSLNALVGYIEGKIRGYDCCAGTGIQTIKDVMPYGKTAADKCGVCFIIHANGQTECY